MHTGSDASARRSQMRAPPAARLLGSFITNSLVVTASKRLTPPKPARWEFRHDRDTAATDGSDD